MTNEQKPQLPKPSPVEVKKLTESVYVVTGGLGANSGIIATPKGALVIDVKMSEEFGKVVYDEAVKLNKADVEQIILTHSDIDHVNGLTAFPRGIRITATEKTKQEMETEFKAKGADALMAYLPNDTYTKEKELDFHGIVIKLIHVDTGHTGGDTMVYIPSARIVFVGDLVFVSRPQIIHRQKGGTSWGLVNNLKYMLSLDADLFIGGHTEKVTVTPDAGIVFSGQVPFATREDVETLLNNIEGTRAKVVDLAKQGKTLDEVKAAMGIKDMPVLAGRPRFPDMAEIVYMEETGN